MFDIAMSCGFKKDGVLTDKAWDFLAEKAGKKALDDIVNIARDCSKEYIIRGLNGREWDEESEEDEQWTYIEYKKIQDLQKKKNILLSGIVDKICSPDIIVH